jgi:hypothetical protein
LGQTNLVGQTNLAIQANFLRNDVLISLRVNNARNILI